MALAEAADASAAMKVQLEILIAAPRDDVVSHGTRAQASTTCSRQRWHVARLALRDRHFQHGADRTHHSNRKERAGAAEAVGQGAGMSLRWEPRIHDTLIPVCAFQRRS